MYKRFFSVIVAIALTIGFYSCDKQDSSEVLSPEREAASLENEALDLLPDAGFGFGKMHWISSEILNLTAAQQEQVKNIIEEQRKSLRPSHSNRDKRPSREEMKALHKERREVILKAMMSVLTPEQQAIVKSIQADFDRGEVPAILVEKRVENFTKTLNLNADQQAQVKALFSETGRKMLALRKSDPERQALRESIKNLRLEADQQLQLILSPEQQAAYEQIKAQRQEQRKQHFQERRKRRLERRIDRLSTALDLSAEQQQQLKQIFENNRPNITEGVKGDRQARREAMKEHFTKIHAQIKEILNLQQLEKYQALKFEY